MKVSGDPLTSYIKMTCTVYELYVALKSTEAHSFPLYLEHSICIQCKLLSDFSIVIAAHWSIVHRLIMLTCTLLRLYTKLL